MIVIPKSNLDDWKQSYLQLTKAEKTTQSYVDYVAHCAAQWAYRQGMIDLQRLIDQDYH
jgi:hypothetical protein